MVIGNGLLASAFKNSFEENNEFVIFAAGVSNSNETKQKAFQREKILLLSTLNKTNKQKFVYFSTCSVKNKELINSPYVMHKLEIEKIIQNSNVDFLIFRISQIVGKTSNLNTLTNYLNSKILSGENITIFQNAIRNLIDIEDVTKIVTYILKEMHINKKIINIASPCYVKIIDLVNTFESILNKKSLHTLINKGNSYQIDTNLCSKVAKKIGINFDGDYLEKTIRKYYEKS